MPGQCCYIKTGGARCGAIALTDKQFCFWHNKLNRHHAEADPTDEPKFYDPSNEIKNRQKHPIYDEYYSRSRVNGPTADELPPLEDAESIQLALSMLIASIADARIETKRAGQMLYGLQLAMINERRIRPAAENSVTDMVINKFGVEMVAPQLPGPHTEAVISTEGPQAGVPGEHSLVAGVESRSGETPVLAPADACDTSPSYIMSPTQPASPSLVMSAAEAA